MSQLIINLAQLQYLRDISVKDSMVKLAQQKQLSVRYDNNIKALGYLIQKTSIGGSAPPSVEAMKNVASYKGSLQRVIEWQEQEKTLAKIKENRLQKNLVKAANEEKIVAITLNEQREIAARERDVREQKMLDELAIQCWLRQRLNRS